MVVVVEPRLVLPQAAPVALGSLLLLLPLLLLPLLVAAAAAVAGLGRTAAARRPGRVRR